MTEDFAVVPPHAAGQAASDAHLGAFGAAGVAFCATIIGQAEEMRRALRAELAPRSAALAERMAEVASIHRAACAYMAMLKGEPAP